MPRDQKYRFQLISFAMVFSQSTTRQPGARVIRHVAGGSWSILPQPQKLGNVRNEGYSLSMQEALCLPCPPHRGKAAINSAQTFDRQFSTSQVFTSDDSAGGKSSRKEKDDAFIYKVDHQSYRQESIRGHPLISKRYSGYQCSLAKQDQRYCKPKPNSPFECPPKLDHKDIDQST